MLLLMIEKEMPIDIVMFADTGIEFPEMYAHLEKLDAYLYEKRGIHITILRAKPNPERDSASWQRLAGHPGTLVYRAT